MRTFSPGETDLLLPLYEGAFEQPMWHTFLSRLRATARTDYATLIVRPSEGDAFISLFSGDRAPSELGQLFAEKFVQDPLQNRGMRQNRLYTLDEMAELGGEVQRAFRDEVLKPLRLDHFRSMRIQEPGGLDAWLGIADRKEISAASAALLSSLAPHLRVALRNFSALERERLRTTITANAVSRMNFGWISIDGKCRILDANEQAERILQRSSILHRGRYNRLTFASPSVDREITALARRMGEDADARPRAINLRRDPWLDMLVAPMRVRSVSSSAQPAAIIYLNDDHRSNADRCDQLVDLFSLTPSEARLAWSLAQGLTVAEAAEAQKLTVETGRGYLKQIFAKTGARRQSELVRHILTSVLALS